MQDYEKFKQIYVEIDELIKKQVTSEDAEFITWHTKAERFIRKKYGEYSEFKAFSDISYSLMVYTFEDTHSDYVEACRNGLEETKAIFKVYLDEMEEETETVNKPTLMNECRLEYSKVFIVHGHDGELKESIARLIERQGIKAIILNEQTNRGATIIEKFERNSEVAAAICLFTKDDMGKAMNDTDYQARARQNVVFEAGYFMGKLGRKHVIMIADEDIEIPSDLQGVVYTNSSYWQVEVLKELKEIGFCIDMNKAF
ncbi:hypothetical protein C804_06293 [Lachnospiraceae bacterium A4]|jgi:predicted nucleotide-binding protein|nr:hypothetical protein C804_06293 [Lachnospiraceae bacterium A4]